jgi:hypothetical protein
MIDVRLTVEVFHKHAAAGLYREYVGLRKPSTGGQDDASEPTQYYSD